MNDANTPRLAIASMSGSPEWRYLFDESGKSVMSAYIHDDEAMLEMQAKLAELKRKATQT